MKKSNFLETEIEVSYKHALTSETNSKGCISSTSKVIPDGTSKNKGKEDKNYEKQNGRKINEE